MDSSSNASLPPPLTWSGYTVHTSDTSHWMQDHATTSTSKTRCKATTTCSHACAAYCDYYNYRGIIADVYAGGSKFSGNPPWMEVLNY